MAREERFRWRDAMICGLLWGLVVLMAVTLTQPLDDLQRGELVHWIASLAVVWGSTGLVWASGIKVAGELRRPFLLFPVILLTAWAVSILATMTPLRADAGGAPGDFGHITRVPLADLAAYCLWVNLFYGGLYTLGYFATQRAMRLRRRLAEMRLARTEAEARLREVRLQAVRGQMQPAMLLDALAALQRAYSRDRPAGDRLFDLLIAFLRAAMPGLRSGASTLAAELAVLDRYAALREALETGPPAWRLSLGQPPPDLAFPPLRLLPALDRMTRTLPAEAFVEIITAAAPDAFVVRVGAPAPQPLSRLLIERLRHAMRRDLGVESMLSAGLTGAQVAELRVRPPSLAPPTA